jgi:hypothetical protein
MARLLHLAPTKPISINIITANHTPAEPQRAPRRNAQPNSIHLLHLEGNPSSQTQTMSLWQSYRNLSPRTRLFIGGGLVAYAAFGLMASDQIEQYLGWTATEEDRKRLPQVHMVDRKEK